MRRPLATLALVATVSAPMPAAAQAVGAEFRVNTFTTSYQTGKGVVFPTADEFVVAWNSYEDVASGSIQAQRFATTGSPIGGPFRVNTFTQGNQVGVRIATNGTGRFVVVWASYSTTQQDGNLGGIYGQRFEADVPVGPEFRVNGYTTGSQDGPAVAMNADGSFVVAWSGAGQGTGTGNSSDVFARRFDSTGAPIGGDFRVNSYTSGSQSYLRAAYLSSGDFVMVWGGQSADGASQVSARRFAPDATPLTDDFRVVTYTSAPHFNFDVAAVGDGGFVVAWNGAASTGAGSEIRARLFAKGGAPAGDELRVNTYTTGDQGGSSVIADAQGRFVVTWHGPATVPNSDGLDAFGQGFSAIGTPIGGEFRANSYTTAFQVFPIVGTNPSGQFVVLWQGTGSGDNVGIFARRYVGIPIPGDADGNGAPTVSDVLYLINFLFAGGPEPIGPGDPDGNGVTNVSDVLYLINYLFAGGPPPVG